MMSEEKKFIVIIPARGGSKRFPKKNIYLLNGKPLIVYSIEYAKKSIDISEIYVTTDNMEIADIAKQYNVKIINRPKHLASDFSTTISALQHAVTEIINSGIKFDYVILLQPTNPLRPQNMLIDAIEKMKTNTYDCIISISLINKKLGKIKNEQFIPYNYQFGQRSQDLEPLYYENGLLYISKKELILNGEITGGKMYPMIINHNYAQIDIDTKEDMDLAEYYLNKSEHE
jgi:N-acylneuraminate cytidylyltransferase